MKLESIRLGNTCYKCTNDWKIIRCMIKKSEYSKLKVKDICKMKRYDSLIEYMNIYKLTKYKMLQVDDKYMI